MLLGIAALMAAPLPSRAETLLDQQGALAPMRDEYTFSGSAEQAVAIQLKSADFDTLLILQDPDGNELERNDDYGGTLNSMIVITLPISGEYTVIASSFSGQGGTYDLSVRSATQYELVYDRAVELMTSEDFSDAIEAYTAAIELNPDDPNAYLGRADAYWGQTYRSLGDAFTGPDSLKPEARRAILADYDQAANLFERQGAADLSASIREQAQSIETGVQPEAGQ